MHFCAAFIVKPTITRTFAKSRGYIPLLQRADLRSVNNAYFFMGFTIKYATHPSVICVTGHKVVLFIRNTEKNGNYEYATFFQVMLVTGHEAILLIGEHR